MRATLGSTPPGRCRCGPQIALRIAPRPEQVDRPVPPSTGSAQAQHCSACGRPQPPVRRRPALTSGSLGQQARTSVAGTCNCWTATPWCIAGTRRGSKACPGCQVERQRSRPVADPPPRPQTPVAAPAAAPDPTTSPPRGALEGGPSATSAAHLQTRASACWDPRSIASHAHAHRPRWSGRDCCKPRPRPADTVTPLRRGHGGQACQPGAAHGLQQPGLGLIAAMVGQQQQVGTGLNRHGLQRGVTRPPRQASTLSPGPGRPLKRREAKPTPSTAACSRQCCSQASRSGLAGHG